MDLNIWDSFEGKKLIIPLMDFQKTDLDIWGCSSAGKALFCSQINMVFISQRLI